jgi:hypothetical protein
MKFLRPRSADKPTLLLVSDAELAMLIESVGMDAKLFAGKDALPWKKLKAELETARKAL